MESEVKLESSDTRATSGEQERPACQWSSHPVTPFRKQASTKADKQVGKPVGKPAVQNEGLQSFDTVHAY